jgi:hypothetical protein
MTPALGMLFLWAWTELTKKRPWGATAPAATAAPAPMTVTPHTAQQAAQQAAAATAAALQPPPKPKPGAAAKPPTIQQAFQASHAAAQQLATQAQQLKAATKAAAPWPAAKPPDLPPFPAGWQPDLPPPPAVVTRAWQLLPILWKGGKPGKTALETIKGRWITFRAEDHGKGKKGVTAYRVKAAATR